MEMLGLTSAVLRIAAAARRKLQRSEMQRIPSPVSEKCDTAKMKRKILFPARRQIDPHEYECAAPRRASSDEDWCVFHTVGPTNGRRDWRGRSQ